MENPNTWNDAIRLINSAINAWQIDQMKGLFTVSLPKHIFNCLETHGYITDPNESEGTKIAAETRARCNQLSAEERKVLLEKGLKKIHNSSNE